MSGANLIVRHEGPVKELVLNRPDKANALNAELVETLIEAVSTASGDGTKLLVLRGEGKAFCGGFDFGDLEAQSDGDLVLRLIRVEVLLQSIHHAPMATIAFCHGGAYGAGADIVCACDSAVAAAGTKFRMPGLRFGIALGTRRLADRIGTGPALEILTGSRLFGCRGSDAARPRRSDWRTAGVVGSDRASARPREAGTRRKGPVEGLREARHAFGGSCGARRIRQRAGAQVPYRNLQIGKREGGALTGVE